MLFTGMAETLTDADAMASLRVKLLVSHPPSGFCESLAHGCVKDAGCQENALAPVPLPGSCRRLLLPAFDPAMKANSPNVVARAMCTGWSRRAMVDEACGQLI